MNKKVYAIKVISKQKILQKNLIHQIRLEVDIQYKLDHPHILKLYDHFEDDNNIYLVLQYCGKGQLYQMVKREGRIEEKQAAQYIWELIQAI